jgi:hypothetical protein
MLLTGPNVLERNLYLPFRRDCLRNDLLFIRADVLEWDLRYDLPFGRDAVWNRLLFIRRNLLWKHLLPVRGRGFEWSLHNHNASARKHPLRNYLH